MKELYNQIDFIVSGGALKLLTDFLGENGFSALVAEPSGDQFLVLDAVGMAPETLVLDTEGLDIPGLFSQAPLTSAFDVEAAEGSGRWASIIRIRSGSDNSIYVLLRAEADEDLIADMYPLAGMIHLWRSFRRMGDTEDRLARLSYMILATKSTLASIFEPMPLDYFASFISDVVHESLFPKKAAVVRDDGEKLTLLKGDDVEIPARDGIFAEPILTPVPVILKSGDPAFSSGACRVVLPIAENKTKAEDGDLRLFCLMTWDKTPDSQVLNFLELLGNLAVRSMSINSLRAENIAAAEYMSSDTFTMMSLSNVLQVLRAQKDRDKFLSSAADIFVEQSHMPNCLLAVWDGSVGGYIAAERRSGGLYDAPDSSPMRSAQPVPSERVDSTCFDLNEISASNVFHSWWLGDCPWRLDDMRYIFPIDDGDSLLGFIALGGTNKAGGEGDGSSRTLLDEHKIASLGVIAQFIAYEFDKIRLASAQITDIYRPMDTL